MRIWTIGHGARPVAELVAVLREAGIRSLVDVRTVPGSRRHPQFGKAPLRDSLAAGGIAYEHLPGLGGRREPRADSPHIALRVDAFRGYADHMASEEFQQGLARLVEGAMKTPTAFMCAETTWAECHRRMLADLLTVRGWDVTHLSGPGRSEPHRLWDTARVVDGGLIYDAGASPLSP
jgi:uncharacterized protein (DUF488 family)